jgi:hypothetical protein
MIKIIYIEINNETTKCESNKNIFSFFCHFLDISYIDSIQQNSGQKPVFPYKSIGSKGKDFEKSQSIYFPIFGNKWMYFFIK